MSHDLKSPSLHFKFPQAAIAEIVAFMDVVIKTRRWRYPRSCGQSFVPDGHAVQSANGS